MSKVRPSSKRMRYLIPMILFILASLVGDSIKEKNFGLRRFSSESANYTVGLGNLGVHAAGGASALSTLMNAEDVNAQSLLLFLSSIANREEVDQETLFPILQEALTRHGLSLTLQVEGATGTLSCGEMGRQSIIDFELSFLSRLKDAGIKLTKLSLDSAFTWIYGWDGVTGNCEQFTPREDVEGDMPGRDISYYIEEVRKIFPDIQFSITYPIAYRYWAEEYYGRQIFPDLDVQIQYLVNLGFSDINIEFDMPYELSRRYWEEIMDEIKFISENFPSLGIEIVVNSQSWGSSQLGEEELTNQTREMSQRLKESLGSRGIPLEYISIYFWSPDPSHLRALELAGEIFPQRDKASMN